jgi:anti-sigma regulatory factor (Ser/Thr protein kinase)
VENGVEVCLVDRDVERFDPTAAPDADVSLSLDERVPGGLGLHLIRRLTDTMEYHYDEQTRTATTVFRKYLPSDKTKGAGEADVED